MLQSLRVMAHSWFFKALMLVLVVSFGIWNIGDIFRGNPLKRVVATAGSTDFTVAELNNAFDHDMSRARQMIRPDLTVQQAKQMGLPASTLNDMIETSLFEQDMKRLGVVADDATVIHLLAEEPMFKNKDGQFDKNLLLAFLQQQGVSERTFVDEQRKNLAGRQLLGAIAAVPPAPQIMLDSLYKAHAEKRILDVVTIDDAALSGVAAPDDKALQDYYQTNAKDFSTPEERGVTIATLTTDSIAKDINISDDQVKKEYDTKADQLTEPEKRDLLQIVLQDEEQAKALTKAARASDLVAAAKPLGKQVVPLNGADQAGLLPELAKPVFALPERGVSDPIKTELGWHVIQVRKIIPSGIPPYDSIKEKLRESMKNDQALDQAARTVNQLDDELAAGKSLEDLADKMKLRLIKIAAVDIQGKTPDGKDPAELPYKDDVLRTAFAQNSGETSPVMDDKNGNYFVVRTDEVTPAAPKPFDQVRADVRMALEKQEHAQAGADKADAIAKALGEGKPASSFASEKGIEVRVSKPISLVGDSDASLPKTALPQILKLKKGEAAILTPQNGKQTIVRLAQVIPAGDAKDDAGRGKIASEYSDNAPKEMAQQYARYLRVLFPVHIRVDAFDSISSQQGN